MSFITAPNKKKKLGKQKFIEENFTCMIHKDDDDGRRAYLALYIMYISRKKRSQAQYMHSCGGIFFLIMRFLKSSIVGFFSKKKFSLRITTAIICMWFI